MTERKLRWGVLSTARIGLQAVNPAIQASRNGDLVAVASRDAGRARAFAQQSGIDAFYGSYDALLADDDVDAVYIPLPNSEHRPWTIRAVQHGKHVLCEKPLASTEAECLEMGAAAEANGVRLMEAFMYRFHPRTEKVLEMVRAGTIGDVRMIRSTFSFRLTRPDDIRMRPELGGGALMDVGCYCVNVSRALAGAEPAEVQAYATWSASGVDELLAGTMHFATGTLAQFDCAFNIQRRDRYEIAGPDGLLDVPVAFRPDAGETLIHQQTGRAEPVVHTVAAADEYRIMVELFADAVLQDRPHPCTATEAALNMRVIEALYRSARDGGKPVSVKA